VAKLWQASGTAKEEFFSEEKNQKTFIPTPAENARLRAAGLGIASRAKVFWFFSSEKNCFLNFLLLLASRPRSQDFAAFRNP
jgi:hypothetical protein